MDVRTAHSTADLEALGTVAEVCAEIERMVAPLKVQATTYDELLELLDMLRAKWTDFCPWPFVSEAAAIEFYLAKLDGKKRAELLGITSRHYEDKELAQNWYRTLVRQVHSQYTHRGDDAFIALQKLYKDLTKEDADE